MNDVLIYTTGYCGYCVRAKALLRQRGVSFREIDVSNDRAMRNSLVERTGRFTVPQIFIDDESIGGYQELVMRCREEDRRAAAT